MPDAWFYGKKLKPACNAFPATRCCRSRPTPLRRLRGLIERCRACFSANDGGVGAGSRLPRYPLSRVKPAGGPADLPHVAQTDGIGGRCRDVQERLRDYDYDVKSFRLGHGLGVGLLRLCQ